MSLIAQRFYARQAIDAAAGLARLQYIQDSPGQADTNRIKASQAAGYIADRAANGASAVVPAYVAGEAAARSVGPLVAANQMVADDTGFHAVKGPAIEQARVTGRVAVNQATTPAEIQAALDAALASLAAL